MPNQFELSIPTAGGAQTKFTLNIGEVLYVLGANGTGKSSLVSRLFNQHSAHAKRISAHRQTWFESNTLDVTPRNRQDLENSIQSQDSQVRSRYWEWNGTGRSSVAIFDLIDAATTQDHKIATLVRAGDHAAAQDEAKNPSPIQVINELMRLSNLPNRDKYRRRPKDYCTEEWRKRLQRG
jgi:ABC-type glutathione transport system ATPase component